MDYADAEKDRLLTAEEVAATLRVSKMTVYRLARDGKIDAIWAGRSMRLSEASLDAYLAQRRTEEMG